jgi:hypothetical protein
VYHELTVWSRGIIMDKEARDVSSCIAAAARAQGLYADNVSDYLAIGMGIAAPLIGALVAATGELPVDGVAEQVADRDAMFRGVAQHRVIEFSRAAPQAAAPQAAAPQAAAPQAAPAS